MKTASTWILTQRAFSLAAGKLPIGVKGAGFIQQISIEQGLTDRRVTLNILYRFTPPDNAIFGGIPTEPLRGDNDVFPSFDGANPAPPWGKGTRGTSNLKLVTAALESACAGYANPGGDGEADEGETDDTNQDGPGPMVSVDEADELDSFDTNYAQEGSENAYNEYKLETRYRRKSGLKMVPKSGKGSGQGTYKGTDGNGNAIYANPTAGFFKMHQALTTMEVIGTAERNGAVPQIPSPETNDDNLVLLDWEISPMPPVVAPDASTLIYRTSFQYKFGMKTSVSKAPTLAMGSLPWVATEFTDNYVTSDDMIHGIIDEGDDSGEGDS